MKIFLRNICPVIAVVIFIGGLWLWIGGTYLEGGPEIKSLIVVNENPQNLFLNVLGLYFFLKCTFCAVVIFLLSRWMLTRLETGTG